MRGEGGGDGGNVFGMRVVAVTNAGQVGAVAMDTVRAAAAAMNTGRRAVVERVAATMMQGGPAAKEEEREVFPHKGRGRPIIKT